MRQGATQMQQRSKTVAAKSSVMTRRRNRNTLSLTRGWPVSYEVTVVKSLGSISVQTANILQLVRKVRFSYCIHCIGNEGLQDIQS